MIRAELDALPGESQRVAELLAIYRQHVMSQPGTVTLSLGNRAEDSNRFIVYEEYTDESAFEGHLGSAACHAFNETVASLLEGGTSRLTRLVFRG